MKREENIQNTEFEGLDWKLFNLLEGNLSADEEAQLMAQIEAEATISEEWENMQQTVLSNEPIVYKHKSSLLKKKVTPVIMLSWWQKPIGIAASIAIVLMMAIPVYHFAVKTNPAHVVSNIHNTAPKSIKSDVVVADVITNKSIESTTNNTISNKVVAPKAKGNIQKTSVQQNTSNSDTSNSKRETYQWDDMASQNLQMPTFNNILNPKTGDIQFDEVTHLPVVRSSSTKDRTFISQLVFDANQQEYTGLRNAVNHTLATLAEPLRSSSIKFRKIGVKGDPGFKIEVRTEQYYAIASVHFLPKMNK